MLNFCEIFDYPIYVVGGCVRDKLLGLEGKDVDIASDLEPQKFKDLCRKLKIRTVDTGIEHGTVTAIINHVPYEHTTFREDVSNDGRNATIKFSKTIEEDLSRRDFTINAIAMLEDKIIDPFGGQADLKNRILRTVGDPQERFSEDYLRIIRAARFQARFNLTLAEGLQDPAVKLSSRIMNHVSIERITDEFKKAKLHGSSFIQSAQDLGFLQYILPEFLSLDEKQYNIWLNEIRCSQNLSELLYFTSLFLPLETNNAEAIARKFKLSNHTSRGVSLFEKHDQDLNNTEFRYKELRRLKINLKQYFDDFTTRLKSVRLTSDLEKKNLEFISLYSEQIDRSIKSPFVNGGFLKESGLTPGPYFKEILDKAGEAQASGKNQQEVEALTNRLIKRHKS